MNLKPEELVKVLLYCGNGGDCDSCCHPCHGEHGEFEWRCLGPLLLRAATQIERDQKEIEALREKLPKWISVEDRLPEVWINEEDDVLVNYMIYSPDFGVDIGSYHAKAQRWVCMGLPCSVTHWMPLPEAPKEVE